MDAEDEGCSVVPLRNNTVLFCLHAWRSGGVYAWRSGGVYALRIYTTHTYTQHTYNFVNQYICVTFPARFYLAENNSVTFQPVLLSGRHIFGQLFIQYFAGIQTFAQLLCPVLSEQQVFAQPIHSVFVWHTNICVLCPTRGR